MILKDYLKRYFPAESRNEIAWQHPDGHIIGHGVYVDKDNNIMETTQRGPHNKLGHLPEGHVVMWIPEQYYGGNQVIVSAECAKKIAERKEAIQAHKADIVDLSKELVVHPPQRTN